MLVVEQPDGTLALVPEWMTTPAAAAMEIWDVRREPGDTARPDALLRRFAERFIRNEWPAPRTPGVSTTLVASKKEM